METKPEVEMSDVANETQEPITVVSAADLVDMIAAGDMNKAGKAFNDLLQGKMDDALEAEKVRVAGQLYNDEEELTDEEIEAELEEVDAELDAEDAEEADATDTGDDAEEAELEEPEVEETPEVEEPVLDAGEELEEPAAELDLGSDEEHAEPEDALGLYADEIESVLGAEEGEESPAEEVE